MSQANGTAKHDFKYIGKPRPMIDGLEKVTGYAKYTGDLNLPGMLYIRPILAQMANAIIEEIDKSEAEALDGVIGVYVAEDLPTRDKLINSRNSATLAKGRTLWVGQPVAVVVAESAEIATDAAELVFVDYTSQPAVTRVMEAIKPDAPKVWPNGFPTAEDDMSSLHGNTELGEEASEADLNNLQSKNNFERGDVAAAFAASDIIVERRYRVSGVHQGYMEPHAVIVDPDPLGRGLTVYTATQGMFDVRNGMASLLDLPQHSIVIKPMVFGGGFGAKYGIYEGLVGAVALKVRQPVKLVLSRSEDFLTSTPAPEVVIDLKTGAMNDGTLTAIEADVYTNNAVFSFNHGGIISSVLGGTYKWQAVKINTFEVNTFTNPIGAYRAPGAPQACFAVEGNIDEIARQLDADLLDIRYQNAVETGDFTGVGRPWPTTLGMKEVLDAAREHPLWKDRKPGDGVGMAIGGWPNFYGNSEAICRVDSDGQVNIDTGIVDISGAKSALVLIAAEVLGVDPASIHMAQGDTNGSFGPGSGGSKVTYTLATAINEAALDAKNQLLELASDKFEAAPEDIEIVEGEARVKGVPDKSISIGQLASIGRNQSGSKPIVGQGKSSLEQAGPGFVAHIVKVALDQESGEIKPLKYVAIQDVGLAINPMMVEGQLQGGAIQGLSIGLYEDMHFSDDGQLMSGTFMDYTMPRSDNTPDVDVIIVEKANPLGLHGARGLAEPPMTAGPPALAQAVYDLTGLVITETPMRAEAIWQAMQQR
ncbi:MAG: xanthine dehydrogenase family protein molybdopterin-binding subunit [Candidatus Promineifilaceae bacterium]